MLSHIHVLLNAITFIILNVAAILNFQEDRALNAHKKTDTQTCNYKCTYE